MDTVFSEIRYKHMFMANGEEILDLNDIVKMKSRRKSRKEREKRGKVMMKKKAKRKKDLIERREVRQSTMMLEGIMVIGYRRKSGISLNDELKLMHLQLVLIKRD